MTTSPSARPQTLIQTGAETKRRLLNAAEQLFAARGFEGTSLRAVTQAAGASVSAANYHFGSKAELLRATLSRRVEPVNRRRLELLTKVEGNTAPPSVEDVIDAYMRPLFEYRAEHQSQDRPRNLHRQLVARVHSDPQPLVRELHRKIFEPIEQRFASALTRAIPGFRRIDAELALQLVGGILFHMIIGHVGADRDGLDETSAFEPRLSRLVAFAVAGVQATANRREA